MRQDSHWTIQLFGGLKVIGPGTEIDRFPTRRSALLLVKTALSRSGRVGRDDLAAILWPDDYLDATRLRLRQELNRLRDTLGPAAQFLQSDRSWVWLELEYLTVDAREFDRLLSVARSESDADVQAELRSKALAHYSGPLLPEQSEDWVDAERQDLRSKYLSALIEQADHLIEQGQAGDALATSLRAVRSDPFHEPARRAAMRAFVELGDIGGALRQYSEFEKALVREYSVRPSESLQAFVAGLVKQDSKKETPVEVREAPEPGPQPKGRRTTLPVFLDRMVGRQEELELLSNWLTSTPPTRLAVITGPGGVGKTRLAVALANQVVTAFGGNVIYVGLAELESGQPVAGKILEAFGFQGSAFSTEPLPQWGDAPCLIVLDNAEHVLDDVRRSVKDILLSHSGVSILVTSRQRLGMGGEQELPLAPLSVPDISIDETTIDLTPAALLFLERARAILPGYKVPEDQMESFVLLLERLDGLPLAIELSAARIGSLNPEQMLNEIDDRFTFLTSRRADVEPRQRSLRATIEWSFGRLDENLKEMLAVIATFRGGCTLEFVRLATNRSDTIDVLQDLVDRSLIQREDSAQGIRYTVLESIRHYILEDTPPKRVSELRASHAELVIDFVYKCSRPLARNDSPELYDAIRQELDNARAAFDWSLEHDRVLAAKAAAGLWRFWCARGRPPEGASYLDRLLCREPDSIDENWGEAMVGRGAIANIMGKHHESSQWFRRAVEVFTAIGNEYGQWWARINLGFSLVELGLNQEAVELSDSQLITVKDPYERQVTLHYRTRALARVGRYEEAMAVSEQLFSQWVREKNPLIRGRAYHLLASTYFDCGRFESVKGLLAQALEHFRESQVRDFILRCLLTVVQEELRLGNLDDYRAAFEEATELSISLGDGKVLGMLDAFEGRRLADAGEPAAIFVRKYESALLAASETERLVDLLATAIMEAHDLAQAGEIAVAKTILGAVEGLRTSTGCGLNFIESQELEAAIGVTGPVEPSDSITSGRRMVESSVAATAIIR